MQNAVVPIRIFAPGRLDNISIYLYTYVLMDFEGTERMFKALGSEARLRILGLLKDRSLCVNALSVRLDMSQPSISRHLGILKNAGLVRGEKRGNMVHYSINPESMDEIRLFLNELSNK